jgi:hypothetical protein
VPGVPVREGRNPILTTIDEMLVALTPRRAAP